ncbi:Putative ring-cleaving dioxygenase mhqO [Listeria grayi]|uniref:Ring-cleaving dioxygenase mhqO n=1 Tax=Listeria grayi TaxID=1641 RepID=A0A378MH72_LISGR|nr:Putative ring-cleaving dioxygenase mhqO [Listeria grayi]
MASECIGLSKVAVEGNKHLYEVGKGGNGGQVILVEDKDSVAAVPGYGEVHHVAFRVEDRAALDSWINKLAEMDLPNSGYVNRFYFESLYVRVGHILFEFATDGPGFMQDEPYEKLGEKLSLPPFLEPKRQEIERAVRPFDTSRKE